MESVPRDRPSAVKTEWPWTRERIRPLRVSGLVVSFCYFVRDRMMVECIRRV